MKKIITLLAFASLLVSNKSAFGQVVNYGYAATSGTYTAITGGTQAAKATGASGTAALDDAARPWSKTCLCVRNNMAD